jgi:methyl-accepting chemotaxis protein
MTLQKKMSMAFIPVMLVVAGIIIVLAYVFARQILSSEAYTEAGNIAARYATEVSRQLETPMQTARGVAEAFARADAMPVAGRRDALTAMLRGVLDSNADFLAVWVVYEPDAVDGHDADNIDAPGSNEKGRYTACWSRGDSGPELTNTAEQDLATMDYWQVPRASHEETALEPYLDSYKEGQDKILMTSCIVPVMTADGAFLGVVGVDINLATITALVSSIHPYDTGYAFIVGNSGEIIADPDPSMVTKPYAGSVDAVASASLGTIFKEGQSYAGLRPRTARAEAAWVVLTPLTIGRSTQPWTFGVSVPLNRIMASVNQLVLVLSAGLVLLLALTWAAMVLIVRFTIRPLRKAVEVTHSLAEGDLTQTLPNQEGKDEIGMLSHSINDMSLRLNEIMRNVLDSAELVASSSQQISSSAARLATGAHSQAATLEETSRAVAQLTSSVEDVSERAAAQETRVGSSVEGIHQLDGAMGRVVGALAEVAGSGEESVRKAREGTESVTRVVAAIQSIAEGSERIAGIVEVISDIADQTNLLALNASIEAARAGEHGRGFAVVAEEVSKLAERSAASAKEIAALITESGKTVISGVKIAQESLSAMDTIITGSQETSRKLNALGKDIEQGVTATRAVSGAMGDISDISRSIASSTGEQAVRSQDVMQAIENATEITQQASAASEEMSAATVQLSELARTLQSLVERFRLKADGNVPARVGAGGQETAGGRDTAAGRAASVPARAERVAS